MYNNKNDYDYYYLAAMYYSVYIASYIYIYIYIYIERERYYTWPELVDPIGPSGVPAT